MTTIACPNCKTVNPATNLFCQSCGTRLAPAPQAAAPTPPPPPQAAVPTPPPPPPPAPGPVPAYPPVQQPVYPTPVPGAYPPPPAPGAYPPPPGMMPPAAAPAGYMGGFSLDSLGVRMEGGLELLEGKGDKVEDLDKALGEALKEAQIPQTSVSRVEVFSPAGRKAYHVVRAASGASAVAYVHPTGKDAAAGWSLYYKPALKTLNLIILGVAVAAPALILAGLFGSWSFQTFLGQFFMYLVLMPAPVVLVAMVVGKLVKGYKWHFITGGFDNATLEEMRLLGLRVSKILAKVVEKK